METEGTTQEKGTPGQPTDKNNQVRQAIIQSLNVWHEASYESLQPRGKGLLLSAKKRDCHSGTGTNLTVLSAREGRNGPCCILPGQICMHRDLYKTEEEKKTIAFFFFLQK